MGKFSSLLAELSQPLKLLEKDNVRIWDTQQEEAFTQVMEELCKPTILSPYNPYAETKLTADASSYGLGAVL